MLIWVVLTALAITGLNGKILRIANLFLMALGQIIASRMMFTRKELLLMDIVQEEVALPIPLPKMNLLKIVEIQAERILLNTDVLVAGNRGNG